MQFTSAIPWTLITNTEFDFTFIFTFRHLLSTTYLEIIDSLRAFTIDGMFLVMVNCTCFFLCVLLYPFTVTDQCNYNNGGCSQLCLLTLSGRACTCSGGLILNDDGRTCKGMMNYDQGGMTFPVWNFNNRTISTSFPLF